jgi:eukaryotic-like serine/threonine-protein kinase
MGHASKQAAPSVYGRYETLFRIAAGGMAEVYAARVRGEAGFQKLVALKRMLPHLTDDDRFVTMFMDEGRLAANISSPNVVSTLDLGRADDGSLYLVMELVVGTTLSTLLRNAAKNASSIPIDVAVEMIAQAAQGLHDAHEARTPFGASLHIVHRDVSPQNILVGTDGRVRITDFGVARAILRRTKTSTGEFKGKLSYFSPEQCADKNLDRRSDLFSLGVVAWETLTTRRLFHAENPLAVLERVTRMPIPPASAINTHVPEAISAVVATALERERDKRYASAAEFAQALRAAARATVGPSDRHKVAELVAHHGGDSLERMQTLIRQSFEGGPQIDPTPLDGGKTEIASGIMFRSEDGSFESAAPIEIAPTAVLGPTRPSEVEAPSETSKLPYLLAALVSLVGLAAGATIGIVAASRGAGETEHAVDPRAIPAASEPPAIEPPAIQHAAIEPPPIQQAAPVPVVPVAEEPRPVDVAPPQTPPAPVPQDETPAVFQSRRNRPRPAIAVPEPRPLAPQRPVSQPVRSNNGLAGTDEFLRETGQR